MSLESLDRRSIISRACKATADSPQYHCEEGYELVYYFLRIWLEGRIDGHMLAWLANRRESSKAKDPDIFSFQLTDRELEKLTGPVLKMHADYLERGTYSPQKIVARLRWVVQETIAESAKASLSVVNGVRVSGENLAANTWSVGLKNTQGELTQTDRVSCFVDQLRVRIDQRIAERESRRRQVALSVY